MPKLRVIQGQTFTAPASITVQGADAPALLEVEFRTLSRKRLQGFMVLTRVVRASWLRRAVEYLKLCWRVKRAASVVDMLDEIIVAWSGAIDADYSLAGLHTLLAEYPLAGINLYAAYLEGLREARIKN